MHPRPRHDIRLKFRRSCCFLPKCARICSSLFALRRSLSSDFSLVVSCDTAVDFMIFLWELSELLDLDLDSCELGVVKKKLILQKEKRFVRWNRERCDEVPQVATECSSRNYQTSDPSTPCTCARYIIPYGMRRAKLGDLQG